MVRKMTTDEQELLKWYRKISAEFQPQAVQCIASMARRCPAPVEVVVRPKLRLVTSNVRAALSAERLVSVGGG